MTPNQLPPLPEPDTHCFDDDTGKDVWSYTADQMHAYALAALAQQAQEPVAWLYVDTVGERYLCFSRPTGGGTITNLYTTPPAPQPAPVDERDAVNMAKARAVFESISKCSHNHQRSARGTYRNPPVARDWKWFQLGIYHATEGAK